MSDKKLLLHNHRGYRWKLDPQPTIALIKACLFSLVKFSYTLGGGCLLLCRMQSWAGAQLAHPSDWILQCEHHQHGQPMNTDKWVLGACGTGSLMSQYCFLSNLNSQSSIHANSLFPIFLSFLFFFFHNSTYFNIWEVSCICVFRLTR